MWNHLFTFQLQWLFSRVLLPFLMALACPLTATELIEQPAQWTACSVHSFQAFPLGTGQWELLASDPFFSAAGSVLMPTLGFICCFCHKWCCNFCCIVRNFSEVCKKWEIINLILFTAGFCCTCCSDFPGHHCFYFTYISSRFLLFL